ncbi:hypothetical protein DE146DRAFT_631893 [Phaeosphaeria sp. MPI-PUGE-AT-0046c]|nr:hypothetical protein DE146DRAFT_631893 [Phaeosphaeria sp. MPI-PUGE-AT-0046c]
MCIRARRSMAFVAITMFSTMSDHHVKRASAAQGTLASPCQRDVTSLKRQMENIQNLAITRSHGRLGLFNGSNVGSTISDSFAPTSRSCIRNPHVVVSFPMPAVPLPR